MSNESYQGAPQASSQPEAPRPPHHYDEKDEKGMGKHDEKHDEKDYEEKWRRDPLGAVIWACILIWAGLAFLIDNLGYWDSLAERLSSVPGLSMIKIEAWSVVFLGAALILVAEIVVRLLVPAYRRPVLGTLILAIVLFGIALGDLISWGIIWPLILIIVGLSILMGGLRRRS